MARAVTDRGGGAQTGSLAVSKTPRAVGASQIGNKTMWPATDMRIKGGLGNCLEKGCAWARVWAIRAAEGGSWVRQQLG